MEASLIQLAGKHINYVAIVSWTLCQTFIMLQINNKDQSCTREDEKVTTIYSAQLQGQSVLAWPQKAKQQQREKIQSRHLSTLILFLTYLALSFSRSWWDLMVFFWSLSTTIPGPYNKKRTCNVAYSSTAKLPVINTVHITVYQQIVMAAILHPKVLVSFPRIPFSETINLWIRGFFWTWTNSCRMCHYEVKCRKAFWLQAHETLWSNCKQTQSSKSSSCVRNNKWIAAMLAGQRLSTASLWI